MRTRVIWSVATLAAAWLAVGPARLTAQSLESDAELPAYSIAEVLKKQHADAVALGEFTPPARAKAATGPALVDALAKALRRHNVRLDPAARLEVKGDLFLVPANPRRPDAEQVVKVSASVFDNSTGERVATLEPFQISQSSDVIRLLGTTGSFAPVGRGNDLPSFQFGIPKSHFNSPSFHLAGARVQSRRGSPYSMEVLAKPSEQGAASPRRPELQDGAAFVPLEEGECFEVRLHNGSDRQAVVELYVDGLNSFVFSKEKRKDGRPLSKYILDPGETRLVKGWHSTFSTVLAFKLTDYPQSAVYQLKGSGAKVGTITAVFSTEHPAPAQVPVMKQVAVGPGGEIREISQEAPTPSTVMVPHVEDSITVRYSR
jgi:hypothetical protein